jgi:hypothetical protein
MKVGKLIELLNIYDPELDVVVRNNAVNCKVQEITQNDAGHLVIHFGKRIELQRIYKIKE